MEEKVKSIYVHNRCDVKILRVEWTIDNFSFHTQQVGEALETRRFNAGDTAGKGFSILFFPNGVLKESKDYVALYFKSHFNKKVSMRYTIAFIDASGNTPFQVTSGINIMLQDNMVGSQMLFKREYLLSERRGIVKNDKLVILAQIEFSVSGSWAVVELPFPKDESLSKDFEKLLKMKGSFDVTLKAGCKTFPAHKAILAARSPVFAAMFGHDMRESRTKTVQIEDVDANAFRDFLHYVYTGEPSGLKERVELILPIAERYQTLGLKSHCAEVLFYNLSVENAASTLVLADRYNLSYLKERIVSYISTRAHEIVHLDSWKLVTTNRTLLHEVNSILIRNLLLC